ncbi:hypothetical protein [Actinomyces sp. Z5]|uniref:hypothetical protein n=1 Tax=Actinomyces sp. Z5 TaxID=2250216 RepID=UPI00215B9083|nr:hypothetical protein [Actinomyces sp. Z5]
MTSTQQEGAPYPADMEHLDDILSIGQGHELPENAEVLSVSPAVNFAASYPGGWGYIIAFTSEDQAIRDYVSEQTGHPGEYISGPNAKQGRDGLEDVDLSSISDPWDLGFGGDAMLLLERPLGRGWLIIRGAPR